MDMTQHNDENDTEPRNAWDVFLAVDDVDNTLQLALDNGATLVAPAMDAGPAGRFAIVTDPTAAVIAMWQAGDTEGYAFTGQPGTPVWFELMTQDFEKAKAFYTAVFDFNPVAMETPLEDGAQTDAATYATNGPESEASQRSLQCGRLRAEVRGVMVAHLLRRRRLRQGRRDRPADGRTAHRRARGLPLRTHRHGRRPDGRHLPALLPQRGRALTFTPLVELEGQSPHAMG